MSLTFRVISRVERIAALPGFETSERVLVGVRSQLRIARTFLREACEPGAGGAGGRAAGPVKNF
jgi:hypothetical protein